MATVTIKSSGSGTGNFTLEPPTTNTDRTLTLPDEAGTVVTSATGGGVYSKDNILGTVSESGGVPTGAIIERGSNANGEFVKYADGTMICSRNIGTLFYDLNTYKNHGSFSYAASFASVVGLSVNGRVSTTTGSVNIGNCNAWDVDNSSVKIQSEGTNGSHSRTSELRFIAVGRWY